MYILSKILIFLPFLAYSNAPITNIHIHAKNYFIGRSTEINAIEKALEKSRFEAVIGVSGIGKTALVTSYGAQQVKKGHFVWLFDSQKNLKDQIYTLAKTLVLEELLDSKILYASENEEWILKKALSALSRRYKKIYIILDDAEMESYMRAFIDTTLDFDKTFILATSKEKNGWKNHISLSEFSAESSLQYIEKNLFGRSQEDIRKLNDVLKGYPIALNQAVSYLNSMRSVSIDHYINIYQSQKENKINYSPFVLDRTAEKALSVTLKKVERLSKQAFCMLTFLCELYNRGIDKIYLDGYAQILGVPSLENDLYILDNFGLIDITPSKTGFTIKIHDFIRYYVLSSTSQNERYLNQKHASNVIHKIFQNIPFKDKLAFMVTKPEHLSHAKELLNSFKIQKDLETSGEAIYLKLLLLEYLIFVERNHPDSAKIIDEISPHLYKLHPQDITTFYICKASFYPFYHSDIKTACESTHELETILKSIKIKKENVDQIVVIITLLAQIQIFRANNERAEEYLEKAHSNINNSTSPRAKLYYYYFKAWNSFELRKFNETIKASQLGLLEAKKSCYGVEGYHRLFLISAHAISLSMLGHYRAGKIMSQDCIKQCKNYFADINNDNYSESLFGLALAEYNLGEYKKAKKHCSKALKVRKAFYKSYEETPDEADYLNLYGDILLKLGELKKAKRYYDKALAIYTKVKEDPAGIYFGEMYFRYFKLAILESNAPSAQHYYNLLFDNLPKNHKYRKEAIAIMIRTYHAERHLTKGL